MGLSFDEIDRLMNDGNEKVEPVKCETFKGNPNGKGKMIYTNGDIYEGDFVNQIPHGKGIYTFAEGGDIYEGDFADGGFHGKGKLTLNRIGVYEGDFVNWKRTGKGKYTEIGGVVYEGNWKDGEFLGK